MAGPRLHHECRMSISSPASTSSTVRKAATTPQICNHLLHQICLVITVHMTRRCRCRNGPHAGCRPLLMLMLELTLGGR
jgi:hypothetical protein